MQKKEQGIATIEAMLVLPIFMAVMFFFISFASMAITEVRMQYAANQTAKELSQYFYVTYKFGLNYGGLQDNEDIDKMLGAFSKLTDEVSEDKGIITNAASDIKTFVDSPKTINDLQTVINGIKADFDGENPIAMIKSLISAVKNVGAAAQNITLEDGMSVAGNIAGAAVMSAIAEPISKALFSKYITPDKGEVDRILKGWGIKEGMDGVDFASSSFLLDGESIRVSVSYKLTLLSLAGFNLDINLRQIAITRAWIGNSV